MQADILVLLLEELFAHSFSIQLIKYKVVYLIDDHCNCVACLKCNIHLLEMFVFLPHFTLY